MSTPDPPPWLGTRTPLPPSASRLFPSGRSRPRTLWAKQDDIERGMDDTRRLLDLWSETADPALKTAFQGIHSRLFTSSFNATEATDLMSGAKDRLLFVKTTGSDVRTYIENGRLLLARRLLAVPDIEMYLIADAAGYDHYATFSRAFTRSVGCPPSEYREIVTRGRKGTG